MFDILSFFFFASLALFPGRYIYTVENFDTGRCPRARIFGGGIYARVFDTISFKMRHSTYVIHVYY